MQDACKYIDDGIEAVSILQWKLLLWKSTKIYEKKISRRQIIHTSYLPAVQSEQEQHKSTWFLRQITLSAEM